LGRTKKYTKDRVSQSTGAHRGKRISTNLVEDNLVEHFNKSPYVRNFGLLMIELHTIPPSVTVNLGKTAATAYDATHGFFRSIYRGNLRLHKVAAEAGLYPDTQYFKRFPIRIVLLCY
jgi:hypothetical protein